jgi:hypothetical protein
LAIIGQNCRVAELTSVSDDAQEDRCLRPASRTFGNWVHEIENCSGLSRVNGFAGAGASLR